MHPKETKRKTKVQATPLAPIDTLVDFTERVNTATAQSDDTIFAAFKATLVKLLKNLTANKQRVTVNTKDCSVILTASAPKSTSLIATATAPTAPSKTKYKHVINTTATIIHDTHGDHRNCRTPRGTTNTMPAPAVAQKSTPTKATATATTIAALTKTKNDTSPTIKNDHDTHEKWRLLVATLPIASHKMHQHQLKTKRKIKAQATTPPP